MQEKGCNIGWYSSEFTGSSPSESSDACSKFIL